MRIRRFAVGAVIALAPAFATAQTPPAPETQPAVSPPRMVGFVDAMYPPQALAARRSARVELVITVAADGTASDVQVVAPVGEGFDEAAVAAARRFTFEPARSNGTAIAARVRYVYVFTPPAEEPPPPPAIAPTGRIEGRVLDRTDSEPVIGAEVRIEDTSGAVVATDITDTDGTFSVDALPPGEYRVRISAFELTSLAANERVTEGAATTLTYRLERERAVTAPEFGATAVVEAPAREVTTRKLRGTELTKVAGTRGDALRSIELLPGIARPAAGQGQLLVRGSSPWDSGVFLDGADIPMLYHFGGLTSVAPSSLIGSIDVHPGNFSVKYGRRTGGVIEVGLREPRTDRIHALADVNMLDTSLQVEGPASKTVSFFVAARRSYIDAWFENVVPADEIGVSSAPVYFDWQAMVQWKPTSRDRVRFTAYGADDRMELVVKQPDDRSPIMRGRVAAETGFHRASLAWKHRYSPSVEHEVSLATGPFYIDFDLGPALSQRVAGKGIYSRSEWRAELASWMRLTGGVDLQHEWGRLKFDGPQFTQLEGNPDAMNGLDSRERGTFDADLSFFRPATYVETAVRPFEGLELIGGVRADYFGEIEEFAIDPRFVARQTLSPELVLKAGIGRFSQPPNYGDAIPKLGNPAIGAVSAVHTSAGVEWNPYERASFGLDSFYKRIDDLIVNGEMGLENAGEGRIYGLEAFARIAPGGRFSGFLSYTLSRSERNDRGTEWRLFDYDQTHILNASGTLTLGSGWTLGSTLRLTTGSPDTPIVDRVYDADRDIYRPIYGTVNSERNEVFHQLDVRVEKQWRQRWGTITGYLDVQNAYNERHVEGRSWNYDYTRSAPVTGLPLLPSLGLRGEL